VSFTRSTLPEVYNDQCIPEPPPARWKAMNVRIRRNVMIVNTFVHPRRRWPER
jgi:hypothetical protein